MNHPMTSVERVDNHLRKIGISMATTQYITQIDDDCWIEDGWFAAAIHAMEQKKYNYVFCKRRLWESESVCLGEDNYESIGTMNQFGYHLMETNSIIFTSQVAMEVARITHEHNEYGHDRHLAKYLINHQYGLYLSSFVGLNQLVPDFLFEFHKTNCK